MTNNWRPNWKDKSKYPGHGTSNIQWHWEFLRRRDDYQTAYDSFAKINGGHKTKLHIDIINQCGINFPFDYRIAYGEINSKQKTMLKFQYDYDSYSSRAISEFIENTQNSEYTKEKLDTNERIEPTADKKITALSKPEHWLYHDQESRKASISMTRNSQIAFICDLNQDLKPQLSHIESVMRRERARLGYRKKRQNDSRKINSATLQEYLRIIDARASGISTKEIAIQFLKEKNDRSAPQPEEDRIKKRQKRWLYWLKNSQLLLSK